MKDNGDGAARLGLSRRTFLGRIGAGAAGAVTLGGGTGLLPGPAPAAADTAAANAAFRAGRFGRMFYLPAFGQPGPAMTAALLDIGRPQGILDARDNLAAGPLALILDPALNVNNPNNFAQTAGSTFFGQFLDHDVTFDTGSLMGSPTAPEATVNGRTPALDLDSVYGAGPVGSPQLYEPQDRAKVRVESGGLFEDLPRLPDLTAVIADPRNDENLIISGLHCARPWSTTSSCGAGAGTSRRWAPPSCPSSSRARPTGWATA